MTKRIRALLLVWLLLALLACNLPVRPRETPIIFEGLATATRAALPEAPNPAATRTVAAPAPPEDAGAGLYRAQSGDTLAGLAARFDVEAGQITSPQPIPPTGLIPPGQPLDIPTALAPAVYPSAILPDSEIVYGPSAVDFDVQAFLNSTGGFLTTYSEQIDGETFTAAQIIQRAAEESSTNPRVLLAVLEERSGWVTGQPKDPRKLANPVGFYVSSYSGLWKELSLTVRELTVGYYGWRAGNLTELTFIGNQRVRLAPALNAGSVAVQYLYTFLLNRPSWEQALYGENGLGVVFTRLFGDPWARAAQVEPLFPAGLSQPELALPIPPGERWSLTGGPHLAWGVGSPRSAIDLAPITGEPACQVSRAWALAVAPGVIARSSRNAVALDLDGDGREQTGWVIFYYHLADQDRVAAGARVDRDTPLGHPSCQGGKATGTHVHIVRKYNGEWLPAGAPLPFVMSGWSVRPSEKAYEGQLVRGQEIITARPDGEHDSVVVREEE